MDSYEKGTYLSFIQEAINRKEGNAFLCKGWATTLFAVLFGIFLQQNVRTHMIISVCVVFAFWLLDAWYIYQSYFYKRLYDNVRREEGRLSKDRMYDMSTQEIEYFDKKWNMFWLRYFKTCLSRDVLPFYLMLVVIIFISFYCLRGY